MLRNLIHKSLFFSGVLAIIVLNQNCTPSKFSNLDQNMALAKSTSAAQNEPLVNDINLTSPPNSGGLDGIVPHSSQNINPIIGKALSHCQEARKLTSLSDHFESIGLTGDLTAKVSSVTTITAMQGLLTLVGADANSYIESVRGVTAVNRQGSIGTLVLCDFHSIDLLEGINADVIIVNSKVGQIRGLSGTLTLVNSTMDTIAGQNGGIIVSLNMPLQ